MYRAACTPHFDTPAAWAEILGPYPAVQSLEADATADVTVIGAGFAGLSAAWRLHQLDPTLDIIVLDAQRIAEGSAGRNSGFMIDLPHDLASDDYAGSGDDRALTALNRGAIRFARDAVEALEIDAAYADPAGKVNGAASAAGDAHNQSYARHLAGLGEAFEMLDARAMRELTGSAYYTSGLYTPGTMILQPAGYVRGLAAGLRRNGVRVLERTPVRAFDRAGDGWQITTPGGRISTNRIILANNGHLESFGVAKGRLMQLFLYASMTPELSADQIKALGGAPRWGVTPADPMGTTMRRIDTAQGATGSSRAPVRRCDRGCARRRGMWPGRRPPNKESLTRVFRSLLGCRWHMPGPATCA
ncbi:NAD(P)/FAD-dependent oxidoreductase [Sulfitobacter aestuariivivens]|uniref:NAD(P)/FAD-dependent oxidoreductase n=1 Tax=Sulfitobacter aestuariivivens TaxID=2766981 RepID=UPI00360B7ED5